MSLFAKIRGTIETIIQFGFNGPQLKNNMGQFDVIGPDNISLVNLRAAAPFIANDVTPATSLSAANVTALRAAPQWPHAISLQGYTTQNDGGQGAFVWSTVALADDGGNILNAGGLGSSSAGWRRIVPTGTFNAQSYGATGNGATDDTAAISRAIAACTTASGGTLFFPIGTYLISSPLTLPANCTLAGSGVGVTFITGDTVAATNAYVGVRDITIGGVAGVLSAVGDVVQTVTVTATYACKVNDAIVNCNFTAPGNVTLPPPYPGKRIRVRNLSATPGTNTVTVVPHGGETINGIVLLNSAAQSLDCDSALDGNWYQS